MTSHPNPSYTFAVCIKCGVQSQPIILTLSDTTQNMLRKMGWKVQSNKFSIQATCPKCQHEKE